MKEGKKLMIWAKQTQQHSLLNEMMRARYSLTSLWDVPFRRPCPPHPPLRVTHPHLICKETWLFYPSWKGPGKD